MSAATTVTQAPVTGSRVYAQPTPVEIDRSCRAPLMVLFTHSIFWLVLSLLLTVIASIKVHAPGLFASMPGLSYGRVSAAASATFLYGFASQAAMAAGLWLLCRLGKSVLHFGGGAIVGSLLWNLGVLVGTAGIFYGNTTGFERFEFPLYLAPILFIGYALVGISGLVSYHTRTERDSYPSTWFVLAAFFTFPWVFSVATLLLGEYSVRGPLQPILAIWYGNNFINMWLAPIALAVIFYFVSKLSQQPLASYGMAAFGFWGYIFLAHATGFQNTHSLPSWLPALSSVINMFLMPIVILTFAWNWIKTWVGHGAKSKERSPESSYVSVAMVAFVLAGILTGIASTRRGDEMIGFSVFQMGLSQLVVYGFISMALFAAMVHIIPRLTDIDWPVAKFSKMHFMLSTGGIFLSVGGLILLSLVHGGAINNPQLNSVQLGKSALMPIGVSLIGMIAFLTAQIFLLGNFAAMLRVCCCVSRREVTR